MYLPNSVIQEPPADGWPTIPVDRLRAVGKSDEVIKLLQHLPYVRQPDNYFDKAQVAPDCYFADYRSGEFDDELNDPNGTNFRIVTEGLDYESVPSHVIGLTSGGRYNPIFLLDTILGIVHWTECPDGPRLRPSRAGIWDRADTYAPVNEQEWRTDAPAWAIVDFFELLKDQFESLDFVPISSKEVLDAHETYAEKDEGMIPMVQAIYRDHGWPDLEVYRKEECLEAVAAALKENYPDYANESDSEDE